MNQTTLDSLLKEAIHALPVVKLPDVSGSDLGTSASLTNLQLAGLDFDDVSFSLQGSLVRIAISDMHGQASCNWEAKLPLGIHMSGHGTIQLAQMSVVMELSVNATGSAVSRADINIGKLSIDLGKSHEVLDFFIKVLLPIFKGTAEKAINKAMVGPVNLAQSLPPIIAANEPLVVPPQHVQDFTLFGDLRGVAFKGVTFADARLEAGAAPDQVILTMRNLTAGSEFSYDYGSTLLKSNSSGTGTVRLFELDVTLQLQLSSAQSAQLLVALVDVSVSDGGLQIQLADHSVLDWFLKTFSTLLRRAVQTAAVDAVRALFH